MATANGAAAARSGAVTLFDVKADPYEMTKLAGKPAYTSTVQRIRELLERLPPSTIDIADRQRPNE